MIKKKYKPKSSFFKFLEIKKFKNCKVYFYQGWHDIVIFRIEILKSIEEKLFLKNYLIEKSDGKEKAFIVTKGKAIFKDEKIFKKNLNKYDCLHTNKSIGNFVIKSNKGTQLFIILSKKKMSGIKKVNFFNFEKNLKKVDLWGGKCISRVFHGSKMTLVLFKLKKGFKFHDKGHKNEQITWLIKGKMKFYVKNKKSSLIANKTAVDIGSYDFHGGKSYGAVGFDAFSPRRVEKRYA